MKLFVSIATASIVTLGLSALPESAQAAPHLTAAFHGVSGTHATVRKVSGFDGFGFGLSGKGCGFGHGGGTGYDGCFVFEKGGRGSYGYNGYGYAKPSYGRRGSYRDGYGYRGGYGPRGRKRYGY